MKRTLAKSLLVSSIALSSAQLSALGLGELELKSALNQPLSAEIELLNVQDLTSWEVKPAIASQDDFDQAGVEYAFFLEGVEFEVVDNQIIMSTNKPVSEPFLNFLLEVKWPSGRVLREYTLLLDPPVFEDEVAETANAPTSQPTFDDQEGYQQTQPSIQASVAPAAVAAPASDDNWQQPSVEGEYKVQYSDTLWEIALATRPDRSISPQEMMMALQQANPQAFINGNINRLKTHHILRVPDAEEINQDFTQAVAEVRRQNNALYSDADTSVAQLDATDSAAENSTSAEVSGNGELRLVADGANGSDQAQASGEVGGEGGQGSSALQTELSSTQEQLDKSRLENTDLRNKLDSLEEQIATMQKLVSLKNDPLAAAQAAAALKAVQEEQAKLEQPAPETEMTAPAEGEGEVAATDENVDFNYVEESVVADEDEVVATDENAMTDTDAVTAGEPSAQEKALIEQRLAALRAAQTQPEPSMVDKLLQSPMMLAQIGGGIFLFLALIVFGIQKRRSKSTDEFDPLSTELTDEELAEFDNADFDGASFEGEDFESADLEGDDFDESLGEFELGGDLDANTDLDTSELDDLDLSEGEAEASSEAQTSDVIGECDIYIAYGRFDQAVELLNTAIKSEPARTDLQIKLLEVYVELDDGAAFAKAQGELALLGDAQASQQAELLAGRLSAPVASAPESSNELEFSTSAATPDLSLDQELPDLDSDMSEFDGGLDFADALDLTDGDDMSMDLPAEDNQLDALAELDQSIEESVEDDGLTLDFDLGDIDVPELSTEPEEVSLDSASDDEGLDFDLSGLDDAADDLEIPSLDDDLASLADSDSLAEPEEELLEFDMPTDEPKQDDDMSELESLLDSDDEGDELDFDLDGLSSLESEDDSLDADLAELSESIEQPTAEPVVEAAAEPVAAPVADKEADIDLDSLVAADDDFDFLAGTDECATKLDLARAYIDMEDVDGARELLDEVVAEGSDQQKQDARDLMDKLA